MGMNQISMMIDRRSSPSDVCSVIILKSDFNKIKSIKHMRKILINSSIFAFVALALAISANSVFAQMGDVARSRHPDHWENVTDSAAWDDRFYHTSVVFNNKVWVMGGYAASGVKNDIWSTPSSNGADWTQAVTSSARWSPRATAASVVFKDKIWIMGGFDRDFTILDDIWFSTNKSASQWTKVTTTNSWPKRQGLAAAVFKMNGTSKIFVSGGLSDNNNQVYYNDVWSSSNGVDWTQVTSNSPWIGRRYHQMLSFNNKLWVIGGLDSRNNGLNDVWYSTNGADWTQVTTSSIPWTGRGMHKVAIKGNKMWLTGGVRYSADSTPSMIYMNDVWKSSNGIDWTLVNSAAPWGVRSGHTSVSADDKLWVMGGGLGLPGYNDVWQI